MSIKNPSSSPFWYRGEDRKLVVLKMIWAEFEKLPICQRGWFFFYAFNTLIDCFLCGTSQCYGLCSVGHRVRNVRCPVTGKCAHGKKPLSRKSCLRGSCYQWNTGPWSSVSTSKTGIFIRLQVWEMESNEQSYLFCWYKVDKLPKISSN